VSAHIFSFVLLRFDGDKMKAVRPEVLSYRSAKRLGNVRVSAAVPDVSMIEPGFAFCYRGDWRTRKKGA
jgi:hypothetical protein